MTTALIVVKMKYYYYPSARQCDNLTLPHTDVFEIQGYYNDSVSVTCDYGYHTGYDVTQYNVTCVSYSEWSNVSTDDHVVQDVFLDGWWAGIQECQRKQINQNRNTYDKKPFCYISNYLTNSWHNPIHCSTH